MDRIYTIRTPEMVAFEFRLAGLGSRFLAWSVDVVFLTLMLFVVSIAGCMVGAVGFFSSLNLTGFSAAVTIAALFAIYQGYFMFFEWLWSGKTPGKRYLGLRVIQDNGTRLATFQAIARNLLRAFDSLAPLYGIGAAIAGASARGQRLGDLVAGTIVVRDEREAKLPKVAALAPSFESPRPVAFAGDPQLLRLLARRLTKAERELLIDAARRADEIALAVRGPLFERLAKHFSERLEIARDPHLSDEKLVQNLARALVKAERGI